MTDKQDLIREIHEYVTAHGGENTATHLLVQAASAIQTQAAELEAVGAGGVSGPLVGSASFSANAGEPWTGGEEWEALAWHLCAEENGDDACGELLWEGGPIPEPWGDRWMKYESDAKRMIELVRKFVAAPPTAQAEGWTKLPGQLPEPGMPVLLDIGKKYPIRAMWAAKHTVQAADDDTDWGEYVEEDDMYYAPEGWYEWNQCEDNHWRVTETPRAWMPIPPTSAEGVEHG